MNKDGYEELTSELLEQIYLICALHHIRPDLMLAGVTALVAASEGKTLAEAQKWACERVNAVECSDESMAALVNDLAAAREKAGVMAAMAEKEQTGAPIQ